MNLRFFLSLMILTLFVGAPQVYSQTNAPAAIKSKAQESIISRAVPIGRGLEIDIYAPYVTKARGLFRPGKKVPVLLYVHGGGWIKGTRAKVYNLPAFANNRNWMLVSIEYRPVPRTNIDGQVSDVVRSINWVRKNIRRFGGDPKKIVIMGHSAGSHLVSMVAVKKLGGKLQGVIANDVQAYDMVAYGGMRGSLPRVYKAAFGSNPANWIKWSPITYVKHSKGYPPFLIMYSGSNYQRRKALAIGFGRALRRQSTRVTWFDGKRYSHGSIASRIGTSREVTVAVERFLRRAFR
ncbi:MAG: alpha/beta hydrolase [Rhizobiaceae bacterium]|nr:alpha/beta hydrolase [Rhizobiaceae bacterium]